MPMMTVEQASKVLSEWLTRKPEEVEAQKAAMAYYGEYFAHANLHNITQEGFKDFLLLKNNRHWSGLHRQPQIYQDFDRLRQCLGILLDETYPLEQRLDVLLPKGKPPFIKGLGRAVLTPVLMCVYPDKYSVYNRISDEGLKRLGRSTLKDSDPFSKRYLSVNSICQQLSEEIRQPLYLIDSMFSLMVHGLESPLTALPRTGRKPDPIADPEKYIETPDNPEDSISFTLEKYLQEFIVSNWGKMPLAKALDIYTEDEEDGIEFHTGVGEIDILARERSTGDWVVIELKKGRNSDSVVGQLLRYMGWIRKHKAAPGENVRGIIITGATDDRIKYAVFASQGIEFFTYKVNFDLVEEKVEAGPTGTLIAS
jgi:hypothetical protein